MDIVQKRFPRLFEPGRIGSLELKNRLVVPPMGTNSASEDGTVTDWQVDYYAEKAKGGAGLVIVEIACVDSPIGKGIERQIVIDDDRFIPKLSKLAEAIKRHGAKAAIQIHHAGRQTSATLTGHQPVAPSPIPVSGGEQPRELTSKEIATLVNRFGEAARRAKDAGFDGVEIHATHGYLGCQFLSPLSNRRQDVYGGSLENRARFLLEIVKAIRERVKRDYPVWCRLSAAEIGVEGGITSEETQVVAQMAEKAGVDAIHVSAHRLAPILLPHPESPGGFVPLAEAIKKVVSVPVIAVGMIPPELGESVLREGKVDFVSIGRALIADPHLPRKVMTGRMEDITPCIGCLTCSDSVVFQRVGICCAVNPLLGGEHEYELKPADVAKRVVVVGGGPAGMEAARVAALRGHKVVLFDDGPELGGQLLLAAKPPFKGKIEAFRQYLVGQMTKLGIETRLRQKLTADGLSKLNPDAVVMATGVKSFVPDIPGIRSRKVLQASEVLTGSETGKKVVVIGGELVGCETAFYLAERGKKVTIMRRGPELATKVNQLVRAPLIDKLQVRGVSMLTKVKYEAITQAGVVIETGSGERKLVEADTVVLAAGALPNTELLASIKGKLAQMLTVGDCVEPRGIKEAVEEGYRAGVTV